jgi:hypothetical protein
MEFPVFRASAPPDGVPVLLGDGLARLIPDVPWSPDLELVDGHAALAAAQRHRLNLGERVKGRGAEWIPILALTRTLDPFSWPSLPKTSDLGKDGDGKGHDRLKAGRMERKLGIGWLFWSYGDFVEEEASCA